MIRNNDNITEYMAMQFEHRQRLRIYTGEQAKYRHRPLYEVVVARAQECGLAGATVFRGILSFGVSGKVHTSKILELSPDLPVVIEIMDEGRRIEEFLQVLESLVKDAGAHVHVTMEEVRSAVIASPKS